LPPPPLDDEELARLTDALHQMTLTLVSPYQSVDYYRDFNASTRADVEAQSRGARYVLLVMDGHVDLTDGTTVDRILPLADDAAREVAIAVPVEWKEIPPSAKVIADR
jgi:hypothetical protein